MGLKNRDGSDYKLNKPNPIMADQAIWRKDEKLIFHNKIGKLVTLPDPTAPVKKAEYVFDEQMQAHAKEMIESKEPVIAKQLVEPEVGDGDEEKIQIWCLPASYKEYKDSLYGEQYRKIRYGNKFMFEAIMLEQDDLNFIAWTNTKAVTEGSILYPRTYDKRWWRVQRILEENGGYTLYAMISDYQPKFSE